MINKANLKQLIKEELSKYLSEDEDIDLSGDSEEAPTAVTPTAKTGTTQGQNYLEPLKRALTKQGAKIQYAEGKTITVNTVIKKPPMGASQAIVLEVSPSAEKRSGPAMMAGPLFGGRTFYIVGASTGLNRVQIKTDIRGNIDTIAQNTKVDPSAIWNVISNFIKNEMLGLS